MLFGILSGVNVVSHDLAALSSSSSRSSALFAAYVLVMANTGLVMRLSAWLGAAVQLQLLVALNGPLQSLEIIVSTSETMSFMYRYLTNIERGNFGHVR